MAECPDTFGGQSQGLEIWEPELLEFPLVVKFGPHQSYHLSVKSGNTILEVKKLISEQSSTAVNNINLVSAGQVLHDQKTLKACDLGSHTVLHAFCWSDDGLQSSCGPSTSVQTLPPVSNNGHSFPHRETHDKGESSVDEDFVDNSSGDGNLKPQVKSCFFVFCKICDCVRRGRLRVICRQCSSGVFIVKRGPNNWEDISHNTAVRGQCKLCNNTIPKFYFKCIQGHPAEMGTVAVLKHIHVNRYRVECIICTAICSHILVFPCQARHVICLDCFRQYCSSCLSERHFVEHPEHGYTVPCPAGCEESHIEDSHHFILMGKEKYERYKNFGAEEFVLQNGGLLCPGPGCGAGLFPEESERRVQCMECQYECCRECRREAHTGTCEENLNSQLFDVVGLTVDEEHARKASWEMQSLGLIEETTKPCPKCKVKTERSGGCMHMVCSRCSEEWCWICVKEWNRDCQADHWFG